MKEWRMIHGMNFILVDHFNDDKGNSSPLRAPRTPRLGQ